MKDYCHPPIETVTLEAVMHALSDPCRLAIVRCLMKSEHDMACNEFDLEVSKATGSHHFEVLRSAGIIETRIEGVRGLSRIRKEELESRFPGLLGLVGKG